MDEWMAWQTEQGGRCSGWIGGWRIGHALAAGLPSLPTNSWCSASSKPLPAWLPRVATAANAGGTVQLRPAAPVQVRYVLIWFTKLPPDNAGHYQAAVYRITVQGHR